MLFNRMNYHVLVSNRSMETLKFQAVQVKPEIVRSLEDVLIYLLFRFRSVVAVELDNNSTITLGYGPPSSHTIQRP